VDASPHVLRDRLVFITGASSGIGASCARAFARQGCRLLVCARRLDRLQALSRELQAEHGIRCRCLELDVTRRPDVQKTLDSLPSEWAEVDILVNNAGGAHGLDKFQDGDFADWEKMIDTNVKGLLYVSRWVIPRMVSRGRGHVINIGSVAGHQPYPRGAVYCGSKAAERAISQGLKMDLTGSPIRVTSIDPGMVRTEFSLVRFRGDRDRADKVYENMVPLTPDDIAEAVVWSASRPPHVNVSEMVILPTAQSAVGLVHRGPVTIE
jgi:serine 3-dehydrogenase